MSQPNLKLLNVGCGRRFHTAWTNIDLIAQSAEVRQYDLRKGLPYPDNEFDGVYHSHVLEHLTPTEAKAMLRECYRVLKPGGVLRVVVPNLEEIATEYLASIAQIDSCANQSKNAKQFSDHGWMTLELIDQMTRQQSGGNMAVMMRDNHLVNRDFLVRRLGQEFTDGSKNNRLPRRRKSLSVRAVRLVSRVRNALAQLAVLVLAGKSAQTAFREGLFRQSGEIHRWMYDRISLAELFTELQFESPVVMTASESRIAGFDSYQLDREGQQIRKPDSLFMEAIKPRIKLAQATLQRVA